MSSTHVILNLDENGNLKCFCPYDDYLRGLCVCRDKFDCPEAIMDVRIIAGTRPSEQVGSPVRKLESQVKKANKEVKQYSRKINQGLVKLERAVKDSKFKI